MSDSTTRRRFIVAAVALWGATAGRAAIRVGAAWADATAGAATRETLVRMARLLYPHDAISDDVYAEVLDQALAQSAADGALATLLDEAERALDTGPAGHFVDLGVEEQIGAMQRVADQPFFGAIQAAVAARLYYHPAVWALLRYEGPSADKGGYLHRGAGEIDWLPETGR